MAADSTRFDQAAAAWDTQERLARARDLADLMQREVGLREDHLVLDYGGATGLLALQIAPLVHHVTVADSSSGMIQALQEKLIRLPDDISSRIDAQVLDLVRDPLPEDRFDRIVCSMTLHHVEEIDRLLERFRTLLNPGGFLLAVDLLPEDGRFHRECKVAHNGFDPVDLAGRLGHAGFEEGDWDDLPPLRRPTADGSECDFGLFWITGRAR